MDHIAGFKHSKNGISKRLASLGIVQQILLVLSIRIKKRLKMNNRMIFPNKDITSYSNAPSVITFACHDQSKTSL